MLRKSPRFSFRERLKATFRTPGQATAPAAIDGVPQTDEPSDSTTTEKVENLPPPYDLANESTNATLVEQADAQDESHITGATTETSTSEQCWNEAYDFLKSDPASTEDVKAYIETLNKAFGGNLEFAELEDISKRPQLMRDFVEVARLKLSETSTAEKTASSVFQFIRSIQDTIGVALSNIPQAALPWAGVCIVVQMLMQPELASKSNLQGITTIVSRMDWYCALTDHLLGSNTSKSVDGSITAQLRSKVVDLYKYILLYQMKSICTLYRHKGLVFMRAVVNWDDWDSVLKKVTDAEVSLQQDCKTYLSLQSQNTMSKVAQHAENMQGLLSSLSQDLKQLLIEQREVRLDDADRQCRWALRVVDPRDEMQHLESKKDTLLPEAYEWFLSTKEYTSFMGYESSARLLHIQGHAGTGKTMLLMGIIQELEKKSTWDRPAPLYFFFQATESSLNSATSALRSLIWMLLIDQPQLVKHLRPKYDASGPELFQDKNTFFALSSVFREMLRDPDLAPVIFLVDGLDECSYVESGNARFIQLILESLTINPFIHWIVTSRPEVFIKQPSVSTNWSLSSFALDSISLEGPVNAYIDNKLPQLKEQTGYDEEVMQTLAIELRRRAEATFLWVSLALKELHETDGWDAIETLRSLSSGLAGIYDAIVTKIETRSEQDCARCKIILSAVCLAYRPFTLEELAAVTGLHDKTISALVQRCGSFLTVKDGIVSLIHQSAKDYLDAVYQSKIQPLGLAYGHAQLVHCSIAAMKLVLKRNIFGLTTFDSKPKTSRVDKADPLITVRYSCLFWIQHCLCATQGGCSHDIKSALSNSMYEFLNALFLQWLESVSLVGRIPDVARPLTAVLQLFESLPHHTDLVAYLRDAEVIVQRFGSVIDRAPLQAYSSALLFSPRENKVRTAQWKDRFPFIQDSLTSYEQWTILRHRLREHNVHTTSIIFSPDGRLFSGDSWGNICVWDPVTGVCWQQIKVEKSVNAFGFSKCGQWMVSGSQSGLVYIYNTNTGDVTAQLHGEIGFIRFISFSPDSKTVSCVASTMVHPKHFYHISIWDVSTGRLQQKIDLQEVWMPVLSSLATIAVVPKIGSNDIEVWSLESLKCTKTLRYDAPSSKAVSHDEKLLALWTHERIQIYDLHSGQMIVESECNLIGGSALRFSPDSRLLVGMAKEEAIIWEVESLTVHQVLRGFVSMIPCQAVIAPDNKTVAITSLHDVYVYEVRKGDYVVNSRVVGKFTTELTEGLALSPSGNTAAAFGYDQNVFILDGQQGKRMLDTQDFEKLRSLLFSTDGRSLVVVSEDAVGVYDVVTGQLEQTAKSMLDLVWPNKEIRSFRSREYRTISEFSKAFDIRDQFYPVSYPATSSLAYSLLKDNYNQWIKYKDKGLFWVPPGRRASLTVLNGTELAFLFEDSAVTLVQLDESYMSLE